MQDVKYLKVQKYKRTKKGLVTKIPALQKSHSKKRGHSFPVYSKNDLKTWLYPQPTFHLIYSNWVANNYAKDLTPSCDRLSNKLGYSLDNLQVITWLYNKKLGEKDMREGNLPNCRTPYRPVVQRCKKTLAYVNHYISLHDAYRLTGISQGNISKAANGKQKSAGGYIWQLIPDGMRYNKELNKLVSDVIEDCFNSDFVQESADTLNRSAIYLKKEIINERENGFIKADLEKLDFSLVDPFAYSDLAFQLTVGAKKYSKDNWKKGDINIYLSALERHIQDIKKALDEDDIEKLIDDTGIQHGGALLCNSMFIHYFIRQILKDKNVK